MRIIPCAGREIKRLVHQGLFGSNRTRGKPNELRAEEGRSSHLAAAVLGAHHPDEEDLNRHRDYIHYNPVKHGLVQRVVDWRWSSFHRYVRMGYYERDWGEAVGDEVNEDGLRGRKRLVRSSSTAPLYL